MNAVTNAWLDGETVLVASTNNGAVNVAADRANADIGPETEGRIGDPDASLRCADADWAAASMTAAQQVVRAGFSDGKKRLTALTRVGLGGTSLAKAIRSCLPHARGWACTALSM